MAPLDLGELLSRAVALHQAGQFDAAAKAYQHVLQVAPNQPDALRLLGVIAHQDGHAEAALEFYRRAIAVQPQFFEAFCNLGQLHLEQARFLDAIDAYQQAALLSPNSADAYGNLGIALSGAKQFLQASDAMRRAIELRPVFPEAYNNLGNVLCARGDYDGAVEALSIAIQQRPDYADAYNNLGNVQRSLRHPADAIRAYRGALLIRPDFAEACTNLGAILADQQQFDEAIVLHQKAISLRPNYETAYYNLANVMTSVGSLDDAVTMYKQAIRLKPDFVEAQVNLGNTLKDQGQIDLAINAYRSAVALRPDLAEPHGILVFSLMYHPDFDMPAIAEEARRWNERHAKPLATERMRRRDSDQPPPRLKLGFVSPDLREHALGRMVLPLFRDHDRETFELFVYASVMAPDAMTAKLQTFADHWRDISAVSDARAAEIIRADGIDVLVDLSQHMARNRLLIFARKPAPLQVQFAGYPGTTGMSAMDYRLSDPYLDPEGSDESVYSERTCRLPNTFWCYDAEAMDLQDSPLPVPLPALSRGFVTFGCLNNFCKVNDSVIDAWARTLQQVKDSRLILLAPQGSCRQRVLARFGDQNVLPERIQFVTQRPRREYLEVYQQIDIGLDTWPYNGHTTSLDSYWMGVPVVTLVGNTVVGRAGFSQLKNLGLTELAAYSPSEFVQIATNLGRDLPKLDRLRAGLRELMRQSPLMDAGGFTKGFEAALRQMWANLQFPPLE